MVYYFVNSCSFSNSFILFLGNKFVKGDCEMMRKGVTGKVLTFIISLMLAVMALAFLWMFLTKSTDIINQGVQKIMTGMRCKMFCEKGILKIIGERAGMCKGC